jgi:hypothetical protein
MLAGDPGHAPGLRHGQQPAAGCFRDPDARSALRCQVMAVTMTAIPPGAELGANGGAGRYYAVTSM